MNPKRSKFSANQDREGAKQFFYAMICNEPKDIVNILDTIHSPKLKNKIKIQYSGGSYIFTIDEMFTYLLDVFENFYYSSSNKRKYSLFLVVQILNELYKKRDTLSEEQIRRYESMQEMIDSVVDDGIMLEMAYDTKLKKLLSTFKICYICGKGEDDFVVQKNYCPCKKAIYCSSECQRKDWKEHKKVCTYA